MKRLALVLIACSLMVLLLPRQPAHAANTCMLCILEIQVQGTHGEEDQDFVVLANLSGGSIAASSTNPIRMQYYNDQGVLASYVNIATSSIPKDQVYIFVSGSLAPLNASASVLNLPLFSGGGSLQLTRGSILYDKIGWGSAVSAEGQAAPLPTMGATLARKRVNGGVQDTNDNAQDFYVHQPSCRDVQINEIQPFVVDSSGRTTEAWVELVGALGERGDCSLVTKAGDIYTVPANVFPSADELSVIAQAVDVNGDVAPLHLGEVSGQIWFAAMSDYADVKSPVTSQMYANLVNGQTFALVEGTWRPTFTPTPGGQNVFSVTSPTGDDLEACEAVRISELLPNPVGEDTGREWLEVVNEGSDPASLAQCQIAVGSVVYGFLPDDVLGPGEWRAIHNFYDVDHNLKALNFRNSGDTLVALQGLRLNGSTKTIQSVVYTDAPEGQSWSRFSDGWRWRPMPTPNIDNVLTPDGGLGLGPTEFPANEDPPPPEPSPDGGTGNTVSITELLPNPAAPGTDDNDEFVELFNAGNEPVVLRGYRLETGNNFSYSFTFTDQIIPAHGYLTITSGTSSISLANSAGKARLVGADGVVLSETAGYMDAPEGHAWAFLDGGWKWTASPTGGAANILKTPVLTALTKIKSTSTQKTSGTVKSASKASTAAPKAPKTSSAAPVKPAEATGEEAATVTSLHPLVLAVVGGLGVLYAAYEYRQDIANRIYQFRRNRSYRREHSAAAQGRGTD